MQSALITLRPATIDDATHFARLLGDDWGSIGMTGTIPYPCTEPAAREWLARRFDTLEEQLFAILSNADGEFVGTIGLIPKENDFVLGYWIGRIHAGKGYATEAVRLMIEHARSQGAAKLLAETFVENLASQHVLTNNRFVFIGSIERDMPLRGGLRWGHQYELTL
jgi:RimJ/RimL family protein N-acetyltransferase